MPDPPVYSGELYLEFHRGTLTNQHEIKRNNRKAEIALHDLELLTLSRAVHQGVMVDGGAIHPLTRLLLINQFHDILPGTGLPRVNEECRRDVGSVIAKAADMTRELLDGGDAQRSVSVTNTLSFAAARRRLCPQYLSHRRGRIS